MNSTSWQETFRRCWASHAGSLALKFVALLFPVSELMNWPSSPLFLAYDGIPTLSVLSTLHVVPVSWAVATAISVSGPGGRTDETLGNNEGTNERLTGIGLVGCGWPICCCCCWCFTYENWKEKCGHEKFSLGVANKESLKGLWKPKDEEKSRRPSPVGGSSAASASASASVSASVSTFSVTVRFLFCAMVHPTSADPIASAFPGYTVVGVWSASGSVASTVTVTLHL